MIPYVGVMASYTGGGYVYQFNVHLNETVTGLRDLETQHWMDERTRAVFLEFSVYNPNVNLVTVAIVLFEFSVAGRVFPMWHFFTSKLYHYTNDLEIFVAVCEVTFIIFNITFTYGTIKKFNLLKKSEYFSDCWNYIEITVISLGYSVIGLFFQRFFDVRFIIEEYKSNKTKFTSFYSAIAWDFVLTHVLAFLVFLVILKALKLFRFNRNTRLMSDTFSRTGFQFLNFSLIFFITLLGFSCFAYLMFGYGLFDFRDFGHTLMTLFNYAVNVSSYYELQNEYPVIGAMFYFLYVFTIYYILITVFIAILLTGLSETRTMYQRLPPEIPVSRYLYNYILLLLGLS